MNVVYTFDNGYIEIAAVSILSLLESNRQAKKINLYIVDCGISEENKHKINVLVGQFGREVRYIEAKNLEDKIPIKLELFYWSFVCYVRLFFAELLPDVNRVLHIDCDTLVKGSLEDVYNIELNNNFCAACYDCIPSPKYKAGFSSEMEYFSNGLLVFDLELMRKNKIQEKFIEYMVYKNGVLPHLDQDVLNAVLRNQILVLPPEYNVMTYTLLFKEWCIGFFKKGEPYYTKDEIIHAINHPIIVHLVGYRYVSRPWAQPCYHPYNDEWVRYLKKLNFEKEDNLLVFRKKKYGLLREIICWLWNMGYKCVPIRKIEYLVERRGISKDYDSLK